MLRFWVSFQVPYQMFFLGEKAENLKIKIKGEQIEEKEFTKYLGLLIDNKLTWNYHIKHEYL